MENKFLYRSLTQDLRSLNNLTKTLASSNYTEIYSWLDPRKTFFELDDISSFYVSEEKERMKCMELIIDRLYMILNFNVEYLELPSPMKRKLQKNVLKPKNLTLGLTANLLWDKIQQLVLDINIHKLKNTDRDTSCGKKADQDHQDQCTQISVRSQTCSGCKMAQGSIRLLADEVIKQKQNEYVTQAKKYIQESIYEVTQISSIDILAKAIRSDIINIVRSNEELQKQLEDQKRMYQYLNYSYKDGVKRNAELLLKIQELETLEQEHLQSVSTLQSKLSQLHFENYEMGKLLMDEKEKCENFQKEIDNCNEITATLRSDIENYQNKIHRLTEAVEDITSEKESWKKRFSDAHTENKKLEALNDESKGTVNRLEEELKHARNNIEQLDNELKRVCNENEKELWRTRYINVQNENEKLQILNNDLKNIINRLEHELDLAVSHFKELDGRIERNYQEIDSNAKAYVELLKKTQEVVESHDKVVDQIENNSFMNNTGGNDFEVQGDPLYDMMKQVEINKINMDKLEKQNAMLMSTIRKVRRRK